MAETQTAPNTPGHTADGMGHQVARSGETSGSAVAAQAQAIVQARVTLATYKPRDWDEVRGRLLRSCKRTRFAESAIYELPRGGDTIKGFSIRFAEECVRAAGNVMIESPTVYEDQEKIIIRVTATDLESNASYSADVPVPKTMERQYKKKSDEVLSSRVNSNGKTVYLLRITEGEMRMKCNAAISREIRNCALRLIPADILEDAWDQVTSALAAEVANDPDAIKKRVLDGFARLNVKAADLREYLGHPVDGCTPAEIEHLRNLFRAVKEGHTTWGDIMADKAEQERKKDAPAGEAAAGEASGLDKLRQKGAEEAQESPGGEEVGSEQQGEFDL